MKGIYDFSIGVSTGMFRLVSGFVPKWKKLAKGRRNIFPSLKTFVAHQKKDIAWFHVASLGEYEQAKPVIHEFKQRFPEWTVAVTFFSPSGYEHIINRPQPDVDFIAYLPFDTASQAKKFVGLLDPGVVFFVKYDLWANFIFAIKKKGIPLFLFSASLRPDQIYFRSYGGFFRKVLQSFDHIFTQNQQSIALLRSINYERASMTGDTRYDNVKTISKNPKRFSAIELFIGEKPVLVVGSAWEEDMALVIPFINSDSAYRFIIAPHDIHDEVIANWQDRINLPSIKYSEWEGGKSQQEDVLFIDNIGMLSSLYQYGKIAYVGGAMGKGLHNILEPLAYGIPVVFGQPKKTGKFPEADISQTYGCGFAVKNAGEFHRVITDMEEEPVYQRACKAAEHLVNDNLGSAKEIMDHVQHTIQEI